MKRQRSVGWRHLRFLCVLMLILTIVAPFPFAEAASPAVEIIKAATKSLSLLISSQHSPEKKQEPHRSQAPRISILIGETREIPLAAAMTSVLVVSTEIASAEVKLRVLKVTGLLSGETILIAFAGQTRYTFIVEVMGRTYANTYPKTPLTDASALEQSRQSVLSGSYSLSYSAPFNSGPTVLRQSFDFQRKLVDGRTFRFSSDMFKLMGEGDADVVRAKAPGLGLNRLSLGIDGPSGAIDILDSQINISPLTFNNYTMRGFHVASTKASPLRGAEFFAGLARPSLSLFDMNQGRVMGIVLPVADGEFWRVRAGFLAVSPQQDKLGSGGTVSQLNVRFAPSKDLVAEGELAYANGGVSWRAQLDLRHGPINARGQILRVDRRSPLISIGAQSGGRETEAFAIQWQAHSRFSAGVNYNHTATAPPATARRATLDTTTLLANANFRISQNSRLGFRYTQQEIETGAPTGGPRFRLQTRTATVTHDIRLNSNWANSFQARTSSSRETSADAPTDSGFSVGNQLRFSSKRGSATGFINYTRQQSSIAGLIAQNPQLLPPLLQRAFAADPAEFLRTNRDTLALFLPGIELPQTRGLDAGVAGAVYSISDDAYCYAGRCAS